MDVALCERKKDKKLVWQVRFSERDITKMMVDILDVRIDRLVIALRVGKHSKRMANMQKLHDALVQFRVSQMDRLNVIDKSSDDCNQISPGFIHNDSYTTIHS